MLTMIANFFILAVLIPVSVLAFGWLLRLLDKSAGFDWPKMRAKIEADPVIYLSARLIAVAMIVSSLVGKYFL